MKEISMKTRLMHPKQRKSLLGAFLVGITLILALTSTAVSQDFQRGWETQPADEFKLYVDESTPINYLGTYHFGEGEGEWSLTIKTEGKKVLAFYSYAPYDAKKDRWLPNVNISIKNVKITGFIFQADGFLGTFMLEKETGRKSLVLVKGRDITQATVGLELLK